MVGGVRAYLVFGGGDGPTPTTPCGRARSAGWDLSECRLWAYMARFNVILLKVSQNRQVSPKYHQKASHSPYFQNGSKNPPLGILRFPFRLAFSPKELLGHFDASRVIIVKMTKCRSNVHP